MWFKTLNLAGRALLPIVQGGMGVGISAHRLAGAVASENAVGTIASVNLRHHHPDLLDATDRCRDRDTIDQANRVALDREIRAAKLEEVNEERFNFDRVIRECRALFDELALGRDAPKLIVAGGLGSHEQARYWLNNGADAIQVGTAFAVTEEGDAHAELKRVLIEANPDDLKSFISVAGLPARAVGTPWLMRYLRQENTLQAKRKLRVLPRVHTFGLSQHIVWADF
jgi:NAD(P)H-dependent flavin oxidoreductase YrpB (nitropropane dioxygenase family)